MIWSCHQLHPLLLLLLEVGAFVVIGLAEGEDEETGLGPVDGPGGADAAVGLRALGFLAKGVNLLVLRLPPLG